GVIGTHDYPACLAAAAIAENLHLPGPRTEKILICSHKYLSRQTQKQVVPEATPDYALMNPFKPKEVQIPFTFPFFVKPVKGTMSIRAAEVRNAGDVQDVLRLNWIEKIVGRAMM